MQHLVPTVFRNKLKKHRMVRYLGVSFCMFCCFVPWNLHALDSDAPQPIETLVKEIHGFLIQYTQTHSNRTILAVETPKDINGSANHLTGERLAGEIETLLMNVLTTSQTPIQLTARSRIQEVLNQLALQHTEFFKKDDYIMIGQLLGASLLLTTEDGISAGKRQTIMKLIELETGRIIGSASTWDISESTQQEFIQRVGDSLKRLEHASKDTCTMIVVPKNGQDSTPMERSIITRIEAMLLEGLPTQIYLLSGTNLNEVQNIAEEYASDIYDSNTMFQAGGWDPADVMITIEWISQAGNETVQVNIIELATAQLLDSQSIPIESTKKLPPKSSEDSSKFWRSAILPFSLTLGVGLWASTGMDNEAILFANLRFSHAPFHYFRWAIEGGYGQNVTSTLQYPLHFYHISACAMGQMPLKSQSGNRITIILGLGGRFSQTIGSELDASQKTTFAGILFELGFVTRFIEFRIVSVNAGVRFDFEAQLGFNLLGFLLK